MVDKVVSRSYILHLRSISALQQLPFTVAVGTKTSLPLMMQTPEISSRSERALFPLLLIRPCSDDIIGGLGGAMGTQHMLLLCVLIMSNPFSSFVCGEDKHVSLELRGPLPLFLPINPPQPYLARLSWSLATDQEQVLSHLHLGDCFGSVTGRLLWSFFTSL